MAQSSNKRFIQHGNDLYFGNTDEKSLFGLTSFGKQCQLARDQRAWEKEKERIKELNSDLEELEEDLFDLEGGD